VHVAFGCTHVPVTSVNTIGSAEGGISAYPDQFELTSGVRATRLAKLGEAAAAVPPPATAAAVRTARAIRAFTTAAP
jgi:hypothetical protein